jgi:hypothetical protein
MKIVKLYCLSINNDARSFLLIFVLKKCKLLTKVADDISEERLHYG